METESLNIHNVHKDVFISHSTINSDIAQKICDLLEARKITCWIAPRDICLGKPYGEEIINAIVSTKATILVLSDNANKSVHVRNEIERAASYGKPIFPIRIRNILPSRALELFVSSHQWVDWWRPPIEQKADYLAEAIRQIDHSPAIPEFNDIVEQFAENHHKLKFVKQSDNKIHPLRVYDKYQWFISYQSTDALIARHLAEFLIAENKSVWFGEYFICSEDWFNEDHFMNEIRNGIDNSEAGIMLTNKRYWASKYCLEEKERLIDKIHKDKRILIAPSGDQSQIIKDLISTGINFIPFEPAQLEAGRFIGHSLLQKTITDPTRSEQKFPHRINYKGHGYLIDIEGWKTVSHGEKKHRDDGNLFGPEFERTFSKTSCHLKIMIGDQVIQSRPPVEIEIEEANSSVKYLATHMKYGKTFNQYLHNVTDPDRLVYQIALIWALEFAQEAKEQIVGVHLLSVNGHSQFAATSRTQKGTYYRRYSIVIPETDQKKGNAEVLFTFHFKGTNFQDFCRYAFLMDRMVLSLQHQQPSSERTNASPFMKAGRTQMESGRFQEAEESFTEGINVLESAILPENENERPALLDLLSGAHLNRAIVRIRLNDPSSAIHDYSKAIANWENLRNQMGDRWPPAFEDNLQRAYRNLQLLKDRIRS